MKLREIENYGFRILNERAKDGSMTVYAKFGEAEKRNQNSRIYPLGILTREVDRLQAKIASGQFLGQEDHGFLPDTQLKNVSHIVTGLEMKGNNGYATIKILNTDAGRNVQEIIRGKGRIGISTRSVGTVSATGVVQKDLKLLALDLVANPSVANATIGKENILEGIEFSEKNQADEALEKQINELEKESWLAACESGYSGSQDEWEAQYSGSLREMMGLPVNDEKIPVQKLTEEQVIKRTFSYYQEAVNSGYKDDFNTWKEKFPAIVEQAKEKKVVTENKAEPEIPFESRTTWDEVIASGYRGTMAEFEERHPNIKIIRPEPAQKIVVEKTLKERAGIIFTGMMEDNPKSSLVLEDIIKLLEKEEIKKADQRLRKKAIHIVNASLAGSGSSPSQELLERMVEDEIEHQKKLRQERRERNWSTYEKLLQS